VTAFVFACLGIRRRPLGTEPARGNDCNGGPVSAQGDSAAVGPGCGPPSRAVGVLSAKCISTVRALNNRAGVPPPRGGWAGALASARRCRCYKWNTWAGDPAGGAATSAIIAF